MIKNSRVVSLPVLAGGDTMIEKLIGEAMKILNLKYNPKTFSFEVECVMPGHTIANVYQFHKSFFPNHLPVPLLDEMVQVGDGVQIWLKEEELLKSEGWALNEKNILTSPDSPFLIGKAKKVFLGGAHKGIVCLDDKFQPFVAVKGYRFSPKEIKCVLRLDDLFAGKSAKIVNKDGKEWLYTAETKSLTFPGGKVYNEDEVSSLIDVLRRARLI